MHFGQEWPKIEGIGVSPQYVAQSLKFDGVHLREQLEGDAMESAR